jgi:alpha-galactosidase
MIQNLRRECLPWRTHAFCLVALFVTGGSVTRADDKSSGFRRDNDECAAVCQWCDHALFGDHRSAEGSADRRLSSAIPFSFTFDGKPSSQLLGRWKQTTSDQTAAGRQRRTVSWTDERTGLEVTCETMVFADFPAVEWVVRMKNQSNEETPILEDIRPLSLKIGSDDGEPVVFHHAKGSTMSSQDYEAIDAALHAGARISLPAPDAPSQTYLPYFNLQWKDGGVIGAIGWTGQWALSVQRRGEQELLIEAGQQSTHLRLHPGESIRTPRILLVFWNGSDRLRGHNLLRQLLLAEYVPHIDGKPVTPLTSHNTWDIMNQGNGTTGQNQQEAIGRISAMGLEAYWLDAGWYEGGWPMGNGSWRPQRDRFPDGLRSLSDAAHAAGLKFVLWFEPERVCPGSVIEREHSSWLLPRNEKGTQAQWDGLPGRLFDLGDADARRWMTDYLSKCITDWGIDVYRQDRNFHPWHVWRDDDAADRQGIAEIRHIEGLYAMLDDLLQRHPRLLIDNANWRCTGPDLEMVKRSSGSWTCSEAANNGQNPVFNQQQLMGLSLYVPVHSSLVFATDPYTIRSVARLGVGQSDDSRSAGYSTAEMKAASDEIKSLRELYLGDYYPLLGADVTERPWCGWQFDRADLGQGFAVCFRRSQNPDSRREVALRGLLPTARYDVTFAESYDVKERRVLSGRELARLKIEIAGSPGSMLIRYTKRDQ